MTNRYLIERYMGATTYSIPIMGNFSAEITADRSQALAVHLLAENNWWMVECE
jgi:hypothetical protein